VRGVVRRYRSRSIFDLLGTKEDDMTYALGFVASRSPGFAARLVQKVGGPSGVNKDGLVRLQEIDGDGRTDVEIEWPNRFASSSTDFAATNRIVFSSVTRDTEAPYAGPMRAPLGIVCSPDHPRANDGEQHADHQEQARIFLLWVVGGLQAVKSSTNALQH
jgi:hypothetical protein